MKITIHKRLATAVAISTLLFTLNGNADARKINVNIKSKPTDQALIELGEASDMLIMFDAHIIGDNRSPAVYGSLTIEAALEQLLQGTDLEYERDGEKTVLIKEKAPNDNGVEKESLDIEEIIITASRRAQNIQDVAMSVSALGGEEIERKGSVGMADYLRSLPGVNQIDRGAGRNAVIIRGVSVEPQTEGNIGGPTVGIYLADIPLTGYNVSGSSADIKLVDMQRVEVLRGPQGTLYGASSLGGTVRSLPVAPNLSEVEGEIEASLSYTDGNDNTMAKGVFNLPLIDGELAIRAVGYRFENSGYVDNVAGSTPAFIAVANSVGVGHLAVDQSETGSDSYTGGRLSTLWQPNDQFSATLTYVKQKIEQDGFPDVQLNLDDPFQQTRLQLGELVGGGSERLADDVEIVNASFEYDFGWASLMSSSSWVDEASIQNRDIGSFFGGLPIPQAAEITADVFVEELRLTSQLDGPFQYIIGLYYQDIKGGVGEEAFYGGDLSISQPFGSDPLILRRFTARDETQKALFGELSYDISEQLTMTLGMRQFTYDRTDAQSSSGLFATPASFIESDESDATYKWNMTYRPSDETMLYAQFAQGFRPGRPIDPPPAGLCDLDNDGILDGTDASIDVSAIDSDNLDSYEVGGKFALLDNRMTINTAIYRNDWEDIPISAIGSCGFSTIVASAARTQGLELEGALYITDGLRLGFGTSYVDAELTVEAPGLGQAGDRLPGSPTYNANANLQYEFEIAGYSSFIRGDYTYVGGFYNNMQEAGVEAGNYSQLNMRAGVAIDQVDLQLYVNNLTNTDALTWVGTVFANADARAYRIRPRTIGVKFGYHF